MEPICIYYMVCLYVYIIWYAVRLFLSKRTYNRTICYLGEITARCEYRGVQ